MKDTNGQTAVTDSVGERSSKFGVLVKELGLCEPHVSLLTDMFESADAYEKLREDLQIKWPYGTTHMSKEGKRLGSVVARYREMIGGVK